jgi:DNA-binding transcriptional MerR regulator
VATDLTIEQLAAATGMTVRNIRAHQARGLLAPPQVRLRVGYYSVEHVTQLELIRDLQAQGFNLAGIKRLLDDTPGTTERLARFREAMAAARATELSPELTLAELRRRFHLAAADAPRVLARAERLGMLVPAGEDRYELPSKSLRAVAERVVDCGIALEEALAVFEQIEHHCDAVSSAFVTLFMTELWEPFERAGMPERRWAEINAAITSLRPLAADVLEAIFDQRMGAQIEAAFGEPTRRWAPPAPED